MRRTVFVLGLVAATWVVSTSDAFAQRGWGGGGRSGISFGIGSNGVGIYGGNGYYGGRGYSPRYYGNGYYPGYSYVSPYRYATPYYSTPTYYADPLVQIPATNYYQQSNYSDPNSATMTVYVPNPDAEVWFNDAPTSLRGIERNFYTSSLQQAGSYTIKARWNENGKSVDQQRTVQVQPGQSVTVDFRNR